MTADRIFVTGGTGAIGDFIVGRLHSKGYRISVLDHGSPCSSARPGVRLIKGDITDMSSYLSALEGVDTVLHMAAITHTNDARRYYEINANGTRLLAGACREKGVKRIIFLSTRAASESGGDYGRSKLMAERYVQISGVDWVILRIAEVYGTGSENGVDMLISKISKYPLIPVIGDGKHTVNPVHISDVAGLVEKVVCDADVRNRMYTVAGPRSYTYDGFLDELMRLKSLRKARVHIPESLVRFFLRASALLVRDKWLVRDQLPRLMCPKDDDISPARRNFGYSPKKIGDILGQGGAVADIKCPVCGERPVMVDRDIPLYRCPSCSHTATIGAAKEEAYSEEYFTKTHRNWFANPDYGLFDTIYGRLRLLPRKDGIDILDIGCGNGNLLRYIGGKDRSIGLYGIDVAEISHDGFNFIRGDILTAEIDRKFNMVSALAVIEHMADPAAFVKKIRGTLAPGGMAVISTINNECMLYKAARLLNRIGITAAYKRLYSTHHLQHFTNRSLRKLIEEGGFEVISQYNHNYPMKAVDTPPGNAFIKGVYIAVVGMIFLAQSLFGDGISQTIVCRIK